MSIIVSLLTERPYLIFPMAVVGWGGLLAWLGLIVYLIYVSRKHQKSWTTQKRIIFAGLFILVPLTNLFVGVRLPIWNSLPLPEVVIEPKGLAVMVFSAVPWVFAAGLLGPIPATVLAAFSGLILAFWDTHSLYTVFELAVLALLTSACFNQRYRTLIFKGLRHPLFTTVLLSLLYPIIYTISILFYTGSSLTGQIDYAISNATAAIISVAVPLLVAGVFGVAVKFALPTKWGAQPPWLISPPESSIEARFLRNIVPLAVVLVILLMVGDWVIASNAARQILQERMASAGNIAAEGVPYFFDAGQSLILRIADNLDIKSSSSEALQAELQREIRTVPFFRQLFVVNPDKSTMGGYPNEDFNLVATSPDELVGIDLALNGILFQTYTLPPLEGESSVQISFIAPIEDMNGNPQAVLIGRTDIQTNPFAKQIVTSLRSLESIGGTGFLLDENGMVLYHPDPNRLMLNYPTHSIVNGDYYDETAPDGTRQVTYYQSTVGRPWTVVVTIPAHRFLQLALNIAAPLLGMVVLLSLVIIGLVRVGLRTVTSSLKSLAVETDRISQGSLDHPLQSDSEDEVGRLRQSFEQMRLSLKARLDELNRLLTVSQGVASSLEMENAVQPILESALAIGASSARIVLAPSVIPMTSAEPEMPSHFGLGEYTNAYSEFDEQILTLMENQDRIVLTNPSRSTLLHFKPGMLRPESLLSVALHHEDQYYGTFWIAYDSPHTFSHEEVRFLTTLAGQAALAAAKNQLFWSAEFERQRLAAILASTPDPVIVTDHRDHLLLINPVAWQLFGVEIGMQEGKSIEEVIPQPELVDLIKHSSAGDESIELALPDGRFYLATASSIMADDQRIGRVCVLRDVTHFKELDALKSEFVATVSHDLRSPLTLLRGYATMMAMVGELNEQQENYVRKIVIGVENMARLINNLLDLGRIEAGIGLQLEKFPVRDFVEEIVETLRLNSNQKQIKLHIDTSQLVSPLIEADRAMLQQAFHNLLDNAIKYTPDKRDIWIRAKTRKDSIVFEFQDTGIGISPVDKPRLFEKFYRSANRDAKKERGTGLGLAIVKSVAERHRGKVWVDSQLGKGSTFYFEIPLKQVEN
jgi:PAS domain S-box-containing protein